MTAKAADPPDPDIGDDSAVADPAASRDLFYVTYISALLDHHDWLCRVHRTIVGGDGADPDIVGETAYRQTRFAQFLEMVEPHLMPYVEAVRAAHFDSHRLAQKLVAEAEREPVGAARLDVFLTALDRFRQAALRLADHADDLTPAVDPQTRLYTRDYMARRLREQCDLGRRVSQPFCVGLSELDQFEAIESRHGGQVLEPVLHEIARRFVRRVRLYDNVFRYSQSRFGFIFPATRLRDALVVCDRVRQDVAARPVAIPGGEGVEVSLSIGLLEYGLGEHPDDLLKVAEVNLARARNDGRNRVVG